MNREFFNDLGLALLRIGPAALMLTHGYPKLLKLLAAMEWYGIDLPPNRARAAMSLLLCEDRRTQSLSAGFMLAQLSEGERESFETFIDFLEGIPDE